MMSKDICGNPEEAFLKLVKQGGKVDADTITQLYDQLKPIEPSFLCKDGGEWEDDAFDTGHPNIEKLKTMNWAGKTFKSENDVDPVMVYDKDGKRVCLEQYGHAQVSFLCIIFCHSSNSLTSYLRLNFVVKYQLQ